MSYIMLSNKQINAVKLYKFLLAYVNCIFVSQRSIICIYIILLYLYNIFIYNMYLYIIELCETNMQLILPQ